MRFVHSLGICLLLLHGVAVAFELQKITSGPFQTNSHLILSTSSREAVVVDPAPESFDKIVSLLEKKQKKLSAIWITHSHWDHTADCHLLLQERRVPVVVHKYDADNLQTPGSDGLPCYIDMQPVTASRYIKDGEILTIGESKWRVIHTPGHSPGSVCFYNEEDGVLLSGDTLFATTMGNISFPTSSPHLMGTSLFRLSTLPPQTKVFPGHGEATTIEQERSWMLDAAEGLCEEKR